MAPELIRVTGQYLWFTGPSIIVSRWLPQFQTSRFYAVEFEAGSKRAGRKGIFKKNVLFFFFLEREEERKTLPNIKSLKNIYTLWFSNSILGIPLRRLSLTTPWTELGLILVLGLIIAMSYLWDVPVPLKYIIKGIIKEIRERMWLLSA